MVSTTILVFDVNETLLDLGSIAPHFERVFGDKQVLREWFAQLLLYSEAATLVGNYAEFGTLARAALSMIAVSRAIQLSDADSKLILDSLVSLPAHPEVPQSLKRLRQAGYRLFTLTNSSAQALEQQLQSAKLTTYLERSFSVDAVKRFKPAPEPYRYVAQQLDLPHGELCLIAAHSWDILGAKSAGYQAAFVARRGAALFPWGPKPDLTGPDLASIADQLLSAKQ